MKKIITSILTIALSMNVFAATKAENTQVVPFDRHIGIPTTTFIPKGTIGFGAALSYNTYNLGNAANDAGYKMLFGMLSGLHGNVTTVGVSPYISYFVIDNLSVGARFEYNRTSMAINSASLDLGSLGFSFSDMISNFNYLKNSYLGSVAARYYIPFGQSKRFAMFTELRATGGYAQAENYNFTSGEDMSGTSTDKLGTYQDIYQFNIGIIPGITAFFTNNVALEVSVGLVGLDYQKVVQCTNQVEYSMMESSSANFKVNLLAINLGLSFYLPTGVHKPEKVKKSSK